MDADLAAHLHIRDGSDVLVTHVTGDEYALHWGPLSTHGTYQNLLDTLNASVASLCGRYAAVELDRLSRDQAEMDEAAGLYDRACIDDNPGEPF